MDFALSSEQQMLVEAMRSFVEAELMPYENEGEKTDEVRPELIKQIHERAIKSGFYAANMPEELGGGGLDHMPNALLFYWAQGYMSAANIHMLNENTDYVDVGAVDEPTITKLVVEFCQANPDKRPVNAIDKFLQDAKKVEAKESDAFNPWEH